MTTLAGAVPRMMRPGPGQNYPRSGFPLEGMLGPQLIRIPGPGIGCCTPILVSRASSPVLPEPLPLVLPIPRSKSGEGVLVESGRSPISPSELGAHYKLSELAWPASAGSTLPFCFGVAAVRKVDFAAPEASSLSVHLKLQRSCSGCIHL